MGLYVKSGWVTFSEKEKKMNEAVKDMGQEEERWI